MRIWYFSGMQVNPVHSYLLFSTHSMLLLPWLFCKDVYCLLQWVRNFTTAETVPFGVQHSNGSFGAPKEPLSPNGQIFLLYSSQQKHISLLGVKKFA